jgi:glutathione synthase/RimK-type ligase-like ATP-grasp enzyme
MKILVILYDTPDWKQKLPFEKDKLYSGKSRRASYVDLGRIAKKHGIRLTRASFKWYKKGVFKKAWLCEKGWKRLANIKPDIIFDKTPLNSETLKFKKNIAKKVKTFNNIFVEKLCSDKMLTYRYFKQFMTRMFIVNNKSELKKALKKIRTNRYVLKPIAGSSAKGVKFFSKKKLPKKVEKDTLVQEFVDTQKGIPGFVKGVADFRVILINGKITFSVIRKAKKGLISNVSRGGREIVIDIKKIPKEICSIVMKIDAKLKKYKPRIFTADFVFDKHGKPWLMELNSKPGIFGYDAYPKQIKRLETNLILAVKKKVY